MCNRTETENQKCVVKEIPKITSKKFKCKFDKFIPESLWDQVEFISTPELKCVLDEKGKICGFQWSKIMIWMSDTIGPSARQEWMDFFRQYQKGRYFIEGVANTDDDSKKMTITVDYIDDFGEVASEIIIQNCTPLSIKLPDYDT